MNFLPGNKTDSMWIQHAGSFVSFYHWVNFWVLTEFLDLLAAANSILLSKNEMWLPLVILWTRFFGKYTHTVYVKRNVYYT